MTTLNEYAREVAENIKPGTLLMNWERELCKDALWDYGKKPWGTIAAVALAAVMGLAGGAGAAIIWL